jgi:hypothetical protein
MNTMHRGSRLFALLLAGSIAAAPALAQPPWAGGGKGNGNSGGEPQQQHKGKQADDAGESGHGKGKGNGNGKNDKGGKPQAKSDGGKHPQPGAYFNDRNRDVVHQYYASAGHNGKACPPGLAKKNNGCMPPGQAKKWQVGHPLPTTVVTYPVPHQVLISLPPVPVGHKYVQVAGDILLIAVGSMMVVDGINGLSGR